MTMLSGRVDNTLIKMSHGMGLSCHCSNLEDKVDFWRSVLLGQMEKRN